MPENGSSKESGYSKTYHDDVRRSTSEGLEEHEQRKLIRLIDDRCKIFVLSIFKKAHEQAKRNVQKPVFEVMQHAALKKLFTDGVDELLDDKMYKPAKPLHFTQGFAATS